MKKTFDYTAKSKEGNDIKGQILAESHVDAFDYLDEQGYTEIYVKRHFEVDEIR